MSLDDARAAEHRKYLEYPRPPMGRARLRDTVADLRALPVRGGYLDVACGHGEMLNAAADMGFAPVRGTEIVPDLIDGVRVGYAEAHALPFAARSFDVVSLFDVIEHLLPGDDERACLELARVSRRYVLITANNSPSQNVPGVELHINRRPYEEWDSLFRQWFAGAAVTWLDRRPGYGSQCWRVAWVSRSQRPA